MTKIVVTFLGILLLAIHISTPVDAQTNTTVMSTVDASTAPAASNNGSTTVTDSPSSSGVNTTATGAGFAPQSGALSLILPVSIVGTLLHGRC